MKTSVIISTYNAPAWLQNVLWGYFAQSSTDFELIIADDGSNESTVEMLKEMASLSPVPITHVWQPDNGFQKCRIINKAIAVARGDRIMLTDGDCVPRRDFVETHIRRGRPDRFLTGGYLKLPQDVSILLNRDTILDQTAFEASWLIKHGLPFSSKMLKLVAKRPINMFLDHLTPTKRTWNGHNASCQRHLAIQVNGFNEDMQYGGLDVEFGLRLNNLGIAGDPIRYSAIVLHLHHERGYVTSDMKERNREIKRITREEKSRRATRGLDQWLGPDGAAILPSDDRLTRF